MKIEKYLNEISWEDSGMWDGKTYVYLALDEMSPGSHVNPGTIQIFGIFNERKRAQETGASNIIKIQLDKKGKYFKNTQLK